MTRKNQIIEAGIEYTMQNNPMCIGGDNFYEQAREFNRNKSFEAGAQWADENPINVWHDAGEEPLGEWKIIILDTYGEFFSYTKVEARHMYEEKRGWESFVKSVALIKWVYISDVLPKE